VRRDLSRLGHKAPLLPSVVSGCAALMSEASALSEAKQVLLSALDSINEIEKEMDAEVRHVAVVYSVYKEEDGAIHDNGGWNHSSAPAWLIGAMLRRGADAIEDATESAEDDED
jgi:hypothetical protein